MYVFDGNGMRPFGVSDKTPWVRESNSGIKLYFSVRGLFTQVNKARGAQIHWGSLYGKSHNALGYSTFRCVLRFEGVTDWYQSQVIMSSATSAVTYTSVYTDSEPGRAFWGADDEEISEGGIPRVIVLGYDGLPMQPVAPPSPDYIPGPEDPQTPPVPQDEDEREPMFVQAHDPDYMPEPIYPEYIPLEDEHEFPAEEQPLPPVEMSSNLRLNEQWLPQKKFLVYNAVRLSTYILNRILIRSH
ncbi:hypothetical protein Tco_0767180 [Tanacetum coccineum]